MYIQRTTTQVVVTAPAKLNLFLEVLAKRDDGFHEIETLMCPVNLYDTLYFRDEPRGGVTLRCEFSIDNRVETGDLPFPIGPENLVVRAVELLRRESGSDRGASLLLYKRIPVAAGLAGGSSDAAAALVAGNVAWKLGYSMARLAQLAAQLGSDVPFFLSGKAAICRGRGEKITPLPRICPLHFVLVRPPAGLSTAAVYQACRPAAEAAPIGQLQAALTMGQLREIGVSLHNRLQPAARSLSPWIGRLEEEFARLNLAGHLMTGSGTSYFGLCRGARHARFVAGWLRGRGLGRVYTVCACSQASIN
jgi:4-diphosphocytidyl-2-C-methyl-D-erythritol kinase